MSPRSAFTFGYTRATDAGDRGMAEEESVGFEPRQLRPGELDGIDTLTKAVRSLRNLSSDVNNLKLPTVYNHVTTPVYLHFVHFANRTSAIPWNLSAKPKTYQ